MGVERSLSRLSEISNSTWFKENLLGGQSLEQFILEEETQRQECKERCSKESVDTPCLCDGNKMPESRKTADQLQLECRRDCFKYRSSEEKYCIKNKAKFHSRLIRICVALEEKFNLSDRQSKFLDQVCYTRVIC